jgi:hypothetical protein
MGAHSIKILATQLLFSSCMGVGKSRRRKMGAGSIHENGFSIKLGAHCMELAQ